MKKNFYIIIGALIIIAIGTWVLFFSGAKQADIQEINTNFQTLKNSTRLSIDYGNGKQDAFDAEFSEGMTAFSLLESEAEKSAITLKKKNYDIGVFIEAIGNNENGQDGKYWLYYVNGKMVNVSADKKFLSAGDKVEFKFEKSAF